MEEAKLQFVPFVFEEVTHDDVLIVLKHLIFTVDKRGEESQVLGGNFLFPVLQGSLSLDKAVVYQTVNNSLVDGRLNGDVVVLQHA